MGPASVEVGLGAANERALVKAVPDLERRLSRTGAVVPLEKVLEGRPAPLFEYEGPTSRLAARGALFVAAQWERTAVLLVGSAENAIGVPGADRAHMPVSADPVGAVRRLFEEYGERLGAQELAGAGLAIPGISIDEWERPGVEGLVAFTWTAIMKEGRGWAVSTDALPRTRGVALYAGTYRDPPDSDKPDFERSAPRGMDALVLGSPVWIEQV